MGGLPRTVLVFVLVFVAANPILHLQAFNQFLRTFSKFNHFNNGIPGAVPVTTQGSISDGVGGGDESSGGDSGDDIDSGEFVGIGKVDIGSAAVRGGGDGMIQGFRNSNRMRNVNSGVGGGGFGGGSGSSGGGNRRSLAWRGFNVGSSVRPSFVRSNRVRNANRDTDVRTVRGREGSADGTFGGASVGNDGRGFSSASVGTAGNGFGDASFGTVGRDFSGASFGTAGRDFSGASFDNAGRRFSTASVGSGARRDTGGSSYSDTRSSTAVRGFGNANGGNTGSGFSGSSGVNAVRVFSRKNTGFGGNSRANANSDVSVESRGGGDRAFGGNGIEQLVEENKGRSIGAGAVGRSGYGSGGGGGGGGGWSLASAVAGGGIPGQDYPILASVPNTGFSCIGQVPGYYADTSPDAGCQVFHICQVGGRKTSFLCPNGTIFNQQFFVCDWWFNFDCTTADQFYDLNNEIGRVPSRGGGGDESLVKSHT
ncbi:glycine-rich cell wall structural protein-like [Homarus americanus]|uniref:glycine-rich cell wall structural protein-like n=1 Tax=Homarus americanus TaxID=6706 RepID=UPI001C4455B5|nr:glycine-rich cell wall structural protein-like [Homarus americanus]